MSSVEALKAELNETKKDFNILVGLISYMAGRLNLIDLDTEDPGKTLQKESDEFTKLYGHEPINWNPDVPYDPSQHETVVMEVVDKNGLKRVTKADMLESLARQAREKEVLSLEWVLQVLSR